MSVLLLDDENEVSGGCSSLSGWVGVQCGLRLPRLLGPECDVEVEMNVLEVVPSVDDANEASGGCYPPPAGGEGQFGRESGPQT